MTRWCQEISEADETLFVQHHVEVPTPGDVLASRLLGACDIHMHI